MTSNIRLFITLSSLVSVRLYFVTVIESIRYERKTIGECKIWRVVFFTIGTHLAFSIPPVLRFSELSRWLTIVLWPIFYEHGLKISRKQTISNFCIYNRIVSHQPDFNFGVFFPSKFFFGLIKNDVKKVENLESHPMDWDTTLLFHSQ